MKGACLLVALRTGIACRASTSARLHVQALQVRRPRSMRCPTPHAPSPGGSVMGSVGVACARGGVHVSSNKLEPEPVACDRECQP